MIPLIRSLAAAPSDGLSAADGRRLLVSLQGPQAIALAPLARSRESGSKFSTGYAVRTIQADTFTEG